MSALETYLEKMQGDAAALEAIARAMRALSTREEEDARALLVDLAEKAFSLSSGLNESLDIVNLPKGAVA
ncbi:hypothetical protein [Paracoccus ravus]|uniref:hypothetical protein n=1 Tax=Paracoccus ravus TaxID=2447760 RepID=UPI00106E7E14|nr:hypothetical protein [Paracoccus ravus]